jgi:putative hydrolase of the HAD superfamily
LKSGARRVVVFDIDDTLYLERDYALSGFRAVGRWLEERHAIAEFTKAAIDLFDAGRRGNVFDLAIASLGRPDASVLVPAMVDVYRAHEADIRLATDASALLSGLHGQCRLACITDGPVASQSAKVRALGLAEWLTPIVLTDVWGPSFRKPNPRAFREIESATSLSGSDCLYIADNPIKDFIAPVTLGWRTIRIRRPGSLHEQLETPGEVPHELPSLTGVRALLADWI